MHQIERCGACRNGAIAEYLKSEGFDGACAAFCEEAGVDEEVVNGDKRLLEKKWTSVVRLQKKVLS